MRKLLIKYGENYLLIIGERINSSIKRIEAAIINKDSALIQHEATAQVQAGAQVIDLNAGTLIKSEPDELVWLIKTVYGALAEDKNVKFALDSSSPEAIEAGLKELASLGKAEKTIINSVTAEQAKLDIILPIVKKYNAQLVGLCMNEQGIPDEPEKRCELGFEILKSAEEMQIAQEDVFLDPLVLPISTEAKKGLVVLDTIKLLKSKDPAVLTVVGLSNISYGLPMKNLLNRTFLVQAMAYGLDAAILNPLDEKMMSMIKTAETLLGNDDFCMKFITAYRDGELKE